MPSSRGQRLPSRPEDGDASIPAQTVRRPRKSKPSFGRDEDGPASSPPSCPPPMHFQTPPPKQSRRSSSATSTPQFDWSGNEQGGADTPSSSIVGDDEQPEPLATPSKSPRNTVPNEHRAVPPLQSRKSAPASSRSSNSGSTRPSRRQRAVSDQTAQTFTPQKITPQKITPAHIDQEIENLVRKLKKSNSKEFKQSGSQKGRVYIFKTWKYGNGSLIYKVGQSKDPPGRLKQIRRECKLDDLEEDEESQRPLFEHYDTAEKLVQKELECYRFKPLCGCKTDHKEYFKADQRMINDALHRWRNFCSLKPWKKNGDLHWRWQYRLDKRKQLESRGNHDDLVNTWNQFLNPTAFQKFRSDISYLYQKRQKIKENQWPIIAIGELWFMALRSSTTSLWLWFWVLLIAYFVLLDMLEVLEETWSGIFVIEYMEGLGFGSTVLTRKTETDPEASTIRNEANGGEDMEMVADDCLYPSDTEADSQDLEGRLYDQDDDRIKAPRAGTRYSERAHTNDPGYLSEIEDTEEMRKADVSILAGEEDESILSEDVDGPTLVEDDDEPGLGLSKNNPVVIDD